jgi:hypothetical protein
VGEKGSLEMVVINDRLMIVLIVDVQLLLLLLSLLMPRLMT